jgi:hypothetical protein
MVGRIIDISANNEHPINWTAVARAGVTTAIIKATEGTTYTNPHWADDRGGALAAGLDIVAYHYAGFGNPVKEAEYFQSVAGQRYARVLDLEGSTNAAWARTFLQTLKLNSAQLATYGSLASMAGIRAQIPSLIWVAAYEQNYPGFGVMWQFTKTSTIPGIGGACDESSWHGTDFQYETLFGTFDLLDPTTTSTPTTTGDDSLFGDLALSKQDNFNATLRHLWNTYRTDPMTETTVEAYWYCYLLPTAQNGFGGSIDALLAHLVDTATADGTLRPAFGGSV